MQSDYSRLLFSAGGRAQLKAWRICQSVAAANLDMAHNDGVLYTSSHTVDNIVTTDCKASDTSTILLSRSNISSSSGEVYHVTTGQVQEGNGSATLVEDETKASNLSHRDSEHLKICSDIQDPHHQNDSPLYHGDQPGSCNDEAKLRCWSEYLGTHMLHSDRVGNSKPWKKAFYSASPETRYMQLSVFAVQDVHLGYPIELYVVAAACSDGFVR